MNNIINNVNSNIPELDTQEEENHIIDKEDIQAQIEYVKHGKLNKIIAVFLGFQGLIGLYHSIMLIFVERVEIEKNISDHIISATDMNEFLSKAVLTLISTALSFFFAIKISFLKGKAAKNIQTGIGIFFILANTFLISIINQLPILDRVLTLINIR